MKKLLVICAAVAALVCACNKYDGAISDLEKRINSTEQSVNNLLNKVDALQKILDAIQSGVSIKSVSPVDGGFTVTFSDNNSFTVVNGKDGQDGKPGEDGKDGEDSKVSYTEDNLCYYFDFGDGNKVAVSKTGAFGIKAEKTEFEIESGVPVEIPFEVIGGDATTKILVEDCPYTYRIGEKAVTISSEKSLAGSFVIKAIRNSDGANSAIVITVAKKAITDVKFQITAYDITQYGAVIDVIPSNKEALYIYSVESAGYVDQFDNVADLCAADLEYWEELYETKYSSYAPTFKEFITGNLVKSGDFLADDWEGYLQPDTDYVAYAYAIDEDTLEPISSELGRADFSTLPTQKLGDVTYLGVAIWHDSIISEVYGFYDGGALPVDMPVDVYEDNATPGVFYFDSPYCAENIMEWFGLSDPTKLQYNVRQTYITIDASDPDAVSFPYQELGVMLDPDAGWASAGATSTGTYTDGVISFTCEFDYGESYEPYTYVGNDSGEFTITMPDANSAPAKPASSKKAAKPAKSQGKSFVEIAEISK
ncbi:MAG: DUF4988 domain-containing protein [Bacteroidales bacterium]|nr:DUF4988 domain-containing protein [Bacteroidales bacterium]